MSTECYTATYTSASDHTYEGLHGNRYSELRWTAPEVDDDTITTDNYYIEINDLDDDSPNSNVRFSKALRDTSGQNLYEVPASDFENRADTATGITSRSQTTPRMEENSCHKSRSLIIAIVTVIILSLFIGLAIALTRTSASVDLCESSPCLNEGTCSMNESGYICLCLAGYHGDRCEETPCTSSPCFNGGQCSIRYHTFTCTCLEGFRGSRCQETPCSSTPCLHGGQCSFKNQTFNCSCPEGFGGRRCQETPCTNTPCLYGGQCFIKDHTFTCTCLEGFGGRRCQETPCTSMPCMNAGQCSIREHAFTCTCPDRFGGSICEETPCASMPCLNGGKCSIKNQTFTCSCPDGFGGSRCQDIICESGWEQLDDYCYYFSDRRVHDPLSWFDANKYCKEMKNGILAEPNTMKKIGFLKTKARDKYRFDSVWIGGSDLQTESIWRWTSTNSQIVSTDWHIGADSIEPNDQNGDEDCVFMSNGYDFEWNDVNCFDEDQFICEKKVGS